MEGCGEWPGAAVKREEEPQISPPRYALSKNIPKKGPPNRRSLHCAPPDFLWRPVALRICMRLSLRRAAQVDVASQREVGNPGTLRSG
jgi:hypothetical protein